MAAAESPQHSSLLGIELLERLAAEFPPRYLTPSPELSRAARDASVHLFSALLPSVPKPLPLDRLLAGEDFDAEQIWHQIDLQSQPLTRALRRDLKPFEKMDAAGEVKGLFVGKDEESEGEGIDGREEDDSPGGEEEDDDVDDDVDGDDSDDEIDGVHGEDADDEEMTGKRGILDDGFFKNDELEKFLDDEDEKEFGGKQAGEVQEEDSEDEDLIDDEDDEDDGAYARYEDFYVKKKEAALTQDGKRNEKTRKKSIDEDEEEWDLHGINESEGSDTDNEQRAGNAENENDGLISTFERESKKNLSKIEQIEKELIAPKSWTMMGEVTASKRPKNSALEVDLDFQHNRVHAPITIEENAASIEDIIVKRLREGPGHLDEVQRSTLVEIKAMKEVKELDDKKSQKGLAEIYEAEYVQKSGIGNAPPPLSDEQRKEASLLFKKLCIKLDALSHFHFKPKPVIEEMSIQTSVPALAMEEVAPLAVSDAAMLAPEEIFAGKGDIKEDAELTKADRKHRRAKKKRKFKANSAKRMTKKSRVEAAPV